MASTMRSRLRTLFPRLDVLDTLLFVAEGSEGMVGDVVIIAHKIDKPSNFNFLQTSVAESTCEWDIA